MTKRRFVALATAIMMAGTSISLSGCSTNATSESTASVPAQTTQAEETQAEESGQWDREVDFCVVGYGLAGAAAAVEAYDIDSEAKILVLEKMPEELKGGNSRASGQTFLVPQLDDLETFKTYVREMNSTNPIPEEYLEWWAKGMAEQLPWVSQIASGVDYEVGHVGGGPLQWGKLVIEFPDLDGSDFKACSAHLRKIGGPAFEKGGLFNCFDAAVQKRNIEVLYQTPAISLVQDPETKEILGVVAKDQENDKEIRIKANKGVLLSCGGFENNLEMQRNFHGMEEVYTTGTPGNTGDGIQMLLEVGAKMWHMNNQTQSGGFWLGIKVPDFESTFIRNMSFKSGSWIEIDATSNRFYNETPDYYHQHMKYRQNGRYVDLPHWRSLPVHLIFDENTRTTDSVVAQWLAWPITSEGYTWSLDNQVEIDKGWVIKADTIEELAEKIDRDPAALRATIDRYNSMAEKGVDDDFGRDPATMQKIEKGPFYAVSLTPSLVATTGGAERNTKGEVLDWDGNPIKGLYEAGELGSYVSNLYQNGVFLSEAILSGRAAAQSAMGGASEVTVSMEDLYSSAAAGAGEKPWENLADGEYSGKVPGTHGDIGVQATIEGGKITKIEVIEGAADMFITNEQFQQFVDSIYKEQSLTVDAVSGATIDCQSIVEALQGAFAGEK